MSDFSQCGLALWSLLYGIIVTLQTIMKLYRISKHGYEIVIGEKGLAVLKTGCLGTNQGVGLIVRSVIIDTNLRGLARVENVERNG